MNEEIKTISSNFQRSHRTQYFLAELFTQFIFSLFFSTGKEKIKINPNQLKRTDLITNIIATHAKLFYIQFTMY